MNVLCVVVRDNFGQTVIFNEIFNDCCYNVTLSKPPMTILDLGANIGLATLFFHCKYPNAQIACLEPVPENFGLLDQNIQLNKVGARVFHAAAAIEDGFVNMELGAESGHHKVANISEENASQNRIFRIPSLCISTVLSLLKWERVNLMKIDIEGYESILLTRNSDWLEKVDAICMEYHKECSGSELKKIAFKRGFSCVRLKGNVWYLTRKAA